MRISDWSSDVCSSDLRRDQGLWHVHCRLELLVLAARAADHQRPGHAQAHFVGLALPHLLRGHRLAHVVEFVRFVEAEAPVEQRLRIHRALVLAGRSEENTSELQSLMRISYAVS